MNPQMVEVDRYSRRPLPTVRDVAAILFRHRWAILITFILIVAASAISGVWTPKYDAKMKILVQRRRSDTVITSFANPPDQSNGDQVSEEELNSEAELLNSEALLRKVVLKTPLSGANGAATDQKSKMRLAMAVSQLSRDLKVEPLRKTNVISIAYKGRNPDEAVQVLEVLATEYLEAHLELHRSSGEYKFFDQQTRQYQKGVDSAQAQLANFTEKTGVVSAQLERDAALQQANEFDSTAHQAQTSLIETEHRIEALKETLHSTHSRMTTVVRTSDNPQLLQQLKSTLLNLELKKTELLTKYQPTFRLVQEVDKQIADANNAIGSQAGQPVREESSDLDPNYLWVRSELTKAETDLIGLKARASTASAIAEHYREMARRIAHDGLIQQNLLQDAKTQEENYLLYAGKREGARMSDALDQRGILNVALAEQPTASALPSRSLLSVALMTVLLAAICGASTAFVLDFMDPSFRTSDELASYLGVPVLAALPRGGI